MIVNFLEHQPDNWSLFEMLGGRCFPLLRTIIVASKTSNHFATHVSTPEVLEM